MREFDFSTATADAGKKVEGEGDGAKGKEEQYVRAPPGVTRNVCSIDFEEMRASYAEELQEWVFTNATVYQGRIVHASCLAELQKGQSLGASSLGVSSLGAALGSSAAQRQRSATPDSSLGKRKAEGGLAGASARLRVE